MQPDGPSRRRRVAALALAAVSAGVLGMGLFLLERPSSPPQRRSRNSEGQPVSRGPALRASSPVDHPAGRRSNRSGVASAPNEGDGVQGQHEAELAQPAVTPGGPPTHWEGGGLSARIGPPRQVRLIGEPCPVRIRFELTPGADVNVSSVSAYALFVRHEANAEWRRLRSGRRQHGGLLRARRSDDWIVPEELVFDLSYSVDDSPTTPEYATTPWGRVLPREYPLRRPGVYTVRFTARYTLRDGDTLVVDAGTCEVRIRAPSHPVDQVALDRLRSTHALTVPYTTFMDESTGARRPSTGYLEWFECFIDQHWGSVYVPHAVIRLVPALQRHHHDARRVERAEALLRRTLAEYPYFEDRDVLLYHLGDHLLHHPGPGLAPRRREALEVFEELVEEHADSEWAGKTREAIAELRARLD